MKVNSSLSKQPTPKPSRGVLYVCATPIGNLDDCSFRLIETLKSVALIASEDTRVTKILLDRYDISTSCVSVQKYNEFERVTMIASRLDRGEDVALVSDAGTPNICDPGAFLIRKLREREVTVIPIPGPSSLTALLSVSGILSNHAMFSGFFPKKRVDAMHVLQDNAGVPIVFFEASKRIEKTLSWIRDNVAYDDIVIAKELTKRYEHIWTDLETTLTAFKSDPTVAKGEWCICIVTTLLEDANLDWVDTLKSDGLSRAQVVAVGKLFGKGSRNDIYRRYEQ